MTSASIPSRHALKPMAIGVVAIGSTLAALGLVAALRSGGGPASAPAAQPVVQAARNVPGGVITYEITGKGLFTATGSGQTLGTTTYEHLHVEGQVAAPVESAPSPDGKWTASVVRLKDGLVYLGLTGADGTGRIVSQLAGSDDPALVAAGKGHARAVEGVPLVVAWSPDSTMLAFGSVSGEPYTLGILRYPEWAEPSITYQQVSGGYVGELAWSPDSSRLAISTYAIDRLNHSVLMASPNGGSAVPTRLSDGCHITWSPDGAYVAVHRDPGAEPGAWVIAAASFADRWPISREEKAFPLTWRES